MKGGRTEQWRVAAAAMARASVEIRPLDTIADMAVACRLLDDVWDIPPEDPSEVRPSLLRALGHAGNYLVGAWAVDGPQSGEMVAASVAFFGTPLGSSMHSHITGVRPGSGHGIGTAVKWHQRAWALESGMSRITWTYDPLIARNAFFNLTRLGARPHHYFVDFYGSMDDGPNRGQPTDRVDVVWDLRSDPTHRAAAVVLGEADPAAVQAGRAGPAVDRLRADGATVALSIGPDGDPAVADSPGPAGPAEPAPVRLIGIPADIEALRRSDPGRALRWRLALRTVLAPLMADERWRVTGFAKSGWYVVERGENP